MNNIFGHKPFKLHSALGPCRTKIVENYVGRPSFNDVFKDNIEFYKGNGWQKDPHLHNFSQVFAWK
jgi:hypothetical protein